MKNNNKKYIAELSKIRTPIIYDTIEKFNVRLRDEGWMDTSIKSILPNLGTMCGYACTGKFIGEIPTVENENVFSLREIWEYVLESVNPSIMVVQDLDYPNLRSCAWGDISASIFLNLGCIGAITNGGVRDIREVENLGFNLFAPSTVVGHGHGRFIEINTPVKIGSLIIQPGDLLHADEHGVTIIPEEIPLNDLLSKVKEFLASEKKIIDYCKKPGFKIEILNSYFEKHEKSFEMH